MISLCGIVQWFAIVLASCIQMLLVFWFSLFVYFYHYTVDHNDQVSEKHLMIVMDSNFGHKSGVTTNVRSLSEVCELNGIEVQLLQPNMFKLSMPLTSLGAEGAWCVIFNPWTLYNILMEHKGMVYITTAFPLGFYVKVICTIINKPFICRITTKWDDYMWKRIGIPKWITRKILRFLFYFDKTVCVIDPNIAKTDFQYLSDKNILPFPQTLRKMFYETPIPNLEQKRSRKVLLSVGRINKEKNLEAFFEMKTDYEKRMVGDGSLLNEYKSKYGSKVNFLGPLDGKDLLKEYDNCDVFVFPSKTDTFGMVVVEALSRGKPVACFRQDSGPKNILTKEVDTMAETLEESLKIAETINAKSCLRCADKFGPEAMFESFKKIVEHVHAN